MKNKYIRACVSVCLCVILINLCAVRSTQYIEKMIGHFLSYFIIAALDERV